MQNTYLIFADLTDDVVVLVVLIRRHQVVRAGGPAVRVHVACLRLGEVGRREAFDRIADVLFCENRQSKKQKDKQRVLAIQFVHAIVHRHVNAADQVVKSKVLSSRKRKCKVK